MEASHPDLGSILFFALLSFALLIAGWKKGFFHFQPEKIWTVPLRWFHIVIVFAIYFLTSLYLARTFATFFQSFASKPLSQLKYISWVNLFNSCSIAFLLILFLLWLPISIRKGIWKREKTSFKKDLFSTLITYLLSFPLVSFVNNLLDFFLYTIFHIHAVPDQLAVYYLKMTFGHPIYFTIAILSIIFFAPFIEELIFRGFLQSFIRQHLQSKQAIIITSVLFALFHYAPEQGLANITIVGSLFILSLFIGFIYEKRGSLIAPMMLHSLFNSMSILHLYLLNEMPKGTSL